MGPTSTLPEILPETLPENSLAALSHAIDLGGDGVEFDVLMTADHKLAVLHDKELNKKIAGADKHGDDLGLISDYTLKQLQDMDIGNGHGIPSLTEVLDLLVEKNREYRRKTGRDLMVNIELKGADTANILYATVAEYINSGKLALNNFVFNSFNWDTLRELKGYDQRLQVMPAIRTTDLFGRDNVVMPGFKVRNGTPYCPNGLKKLENFHAEVGCYAFDCIVFDLRQEFVDFCDEHGIGLFTSTSREIVQAERVRDPLQLMLQAADRLPVACFRADNVTDTRRVISTIQNLPQMRGDFTQAVSDAAEIIPFAADPYIEFEIH